MFGILLEKSIFNKVKLIKSEDIIKFGRDAILVDSKPQYLLKNNLDDFYQIHDKEIYTKKGINIGLVKDLRINEETGYIECLEVSNGIIADIINGRGLVPLIGKIKFMDDCILVEDEAFQEIRNTKQIMEV